MSEDTTGHRAVRPSISKFGVGVFVGVLILAIVILGGYFHDKHMAEQMNSQGDQIFEQSVAAPSEEWGGPTEVSDWSIRNYASGPVVSEWRCGHRSMTMKRLGLLIASRMLHAARPMSG